MRLGRKAMAHRHQPTHLPMPSPQPATAPVFRQRRVGVITRTMTIAKRDAGDPWWVSTCAQAEMMNGEPRTERVRPHDRTRYGPRLGHDQDEDRRPEE